MGTRVARGFTLVELMIVVGIVGILGSIALPTFAKYIARVKDVEAIENVGAISKGVLAYYETEHVNQGLGGGVSTRCVPDPTGITPLPIPSNGQKVIAGGNFDHPSWAAVGFQPRGAVINAYGIGSGLGGCNWGTPAIPGWLAISGGRDDDGDGDFRHFMLQIGFIKYKAVRAPGIAFTDDVPPPPPPP